MIKRVLAEIRRRVFAAINLDLLLPDTTGEASVSSMEQYRAP